LPEAKPQTILSILNFTIMTLENLISVQFTNAELKQMDDAFSIIEGILKGKLVNLSGKQRQQHGRVKYEMEVWVNKAVGYAGSNPALVPAFIDQAGLKADFTAHGQLTPPYRQAANPATGHAGYQPAAG
jgi:hypothetical protein